MHASAPGDGNGCYVATLFPATASGTAHSTTASKSGIRSQTSTDATVLAGNIARSDLVLNISTLSVRKGRHLPAQQAFRRASSLAIETFSPATVLALLRSCVCGTITRTEGLAESELRNFDSFTHHAARS